MMSKTALFNIFIYYNFLIFCNLMKLRIQFFEHHLAINLVRNDI